MPTRKSSASKKFPPAGVDLIEHELAVDMLQIKGRQKEERYWRRCSSRGG